MNSIFQAKQLPLAFYIKIVFSFNSMTKSYLNAMVLRSNEVVIFPPQQNNLKHQK